MKKKMMVVALLLTVLSLQSARATDYRETTQYLGVVNGQVVGNSVVKVTRTPTEPILFRAENDAPLPEILVIRHAESRSAAGGGVNITLKQTLADGRAARLTLQTTLMIDGHKVALIATQRGDDVVIALPPANQRVELRSDAPLELEVPANYRGSLQIPLEVSGGRKD
ncbi:DUF5462 family protein [Edwardsiella tarda]